MSDGPASFVLDTFAVIAHFRAERGGPRVRELLQLARRQEATLSMTVVNQAEVYYKTIREDGHQIAEAVLQEMSQLDIELFEIDWGLALDAARIKGAHRLSYADCIAAALAQRLNATLVTGDPDFTKVEHLLAIEWLLSA